MESENEESEERMRGECGEESMERRVWRGECGENEMRLDNDSKCNDYESDNPNPNPNHSNPSPSSNPHSLAPLVEAEAPS